MEKNNPKTLASNWTGRKLNGGDLKIMSRVSVNFDGFWFDQVFKLNNWTSPKLRMTMSKQKGTVCCCFSFSHLPIPRFTSGHYFAQFMFTFIRIKFPPFSFCRRTFCCCQSSDRLTRCLVLFLMRSQRKAFWWISWKSEERINKLRDIWISLKNLQVLFDLSWNVFK